MSDLLAPGPLAIVGGGSGQGDAKVSVGYQIAVALKGNRGLATKASDTLEVLFD